MARWVLMLMFLAVIIGCGGGETAEKYMQEGMVHFQLNDYDKAIASYQKAIKLEPRAAVAYNMLGMAYRFKYNQLRDPEMRRQEIDAFKHAIDIDPKFWVAMINLGATYYGEGDKAKAAPLFKKALELNPQHPEKAQIEKMIAEGEQK